MKEIERKYESEEYFLMHRFLTGGPWKGSWGSAKITKEKFILTTFFGYSGVCTPVIQFEF